METETKTKGKISIYTMARVAVVTAVFCILAPFSIPIPISPVPLSLTNFVVFLSVFILEWKAAVLSYVLYLLIGLVGLPVFSGFSGGVGKFVGPTGGYLVGMVFLVLILGLALKLGKNSKYWMVYYFIGGVIGEVVLYIPGTFWLAHGLNISFVEGLAIGVTPYLLWDAIKLVLAALVGSRIRKIPAFNF